MTKAEACALLGISPKTLQRRLKAGRHTCTRIGLGQYAELSFTHTDLGLPEPVPEPAPPLRNLLGNIVEPTPEPLPDITEPDAFAPRQLSNIELKAEQDRRFAQDYRSGDATDSAGNTVNRTNARWPNKGIQSLLGPQEPRPKVRPDTTAHMDQRLIGTSHTTIGTDGQPIAHAGSDNHSLNKNSKAAPKPQPHPNQSRDEMLAAIWADIHRGWSR